MAFLHFGYPYYHFMATQPQAIQKAWQQQNTKQHESKGNAFMHSDPETDVPTDSDGNSSTPDRATTSPRTPQSNSSGDLPAALPASSALLQGPQWLTFDGTGRLQVINKPISTEPETAIESSTLSALAASAQNSVIDMVAPPPGLSVVDAGLSPPPGLHMPIELVAASEPTNSQAAPAMPGDPESDSNTITWSVDARKLNSDHKVIVSPSFELEFMGERRVSFKVMLTPKEVTNRKGGLSFKRSRGIGSIQLKCESQEEFTETVSVKFSVGRSLARGPVLHDFAQTGVCSLKVGGDSNSSAENWDFTRAVDVSAQSFEIRVQILPWQA